MCTCLTGEWLHRGLVDFVMSYNTINANCENASYGSMLQPDSKGGQVHTRFECDLHRPAIP